LIDQSAPELIDRHLEYDVKTNSRWIIFWMLRQALRHHNAGIHETQSIKSHVRRLGWVERATDMWPRAEDAVAPLLKCINIFVSRLKGKGLAKVMINH
jgi:hypothetical protein